VADIEKISSSEYAIDGNLSRFTGMAASHHRAKSRHIIRAGVKQDGTLTSIYH